VGASLGQQLAVAIGGFLYVAATARFLTVDERGVVALFIVIHTLVGSASTLGIPAACLHFRGRGAGVAVLLRHAIPILLGAGLLGMLVAAWAFVATVRGASSVGGPTTILVLSGIAIIGQTVSSLWTWMLMGDGRFRSAALARGGSALLVGLVVGGLGALGLLTTQLALAVWVAGWAISLLLAIAPLRNSSPQEGGYDPHRSEIIRYGMASFPSSMGGYVTSRADTWILGSLASSSAAGIYSVALSLADLLLYLPRAVGAVLFSEESKGKTDRAMRLALISAGMVVMGGGLLAVAGGPLLALLFGEGYRQGALVVAILALGNVFLSALKLIGNIDAGRGKPGVYSWGTAASSLLLIVGSFALVPLYGMEGAAVASCAAYAGGLGIAIAVRRWKRDLRRGV
jgi:stage V sporulation protein B